MISMFRRHLKSCKHTSRRYKHRSCPISAEGTLDGEIIRKSLDLRNWEVATRLIPEWEVSGVVAAVTVNEAAERFISDRQSMKLSDAMMRKFKHVAAELVRRFGEKPVNSLTRDAIRRIRESWKLSYGATLKLIVRHIIYYQYFRPSSW